MGIYFTSDTHFGHENIIRFCDRPFGDVLMMDSDLMMRWNEAVGEDDDVWHLGDLTLGEDAELYLSQLNGNIHILSYPFHHDRRWLVSGQLLPPHVTLEPPVVVLELPEHSLDGSHPLPIVLCHYPFEVWDRKHYGALHVHGHVHGSAMVSAGNRFDVGVDANSFGPVPLEDLILSAGYVTN